MFINFKFLLLIALIIPNYIFAKSLIIFVKGDVSIINSDGKKEVVKKGMEVLDDDEIVTGDSSLAVLRIEGHSVHKISENSKLKVSSLPVKFQNSNLLQSPASIILKAGRILSNITKKSDNESLKIKTNNTSMGVRGTQLMTSLDKGQNLAVVVHEGSVEFFNGDNNDLIEAGQTLFIEKDKKVKSLGITNIGKKIKWKFKSADQIIPNNVIRNSFKIKRSKYIKNIERWDNYKAKRQLKIKSWNKNTRQLMKRLVKKRKIRNKDTYVSSQNLFNKNITNKSKHIKFEDKMNRPDLEKLGQRNKKTRRDLMNRRHHMRRKKIVMPPARSLDPSGPISPGTP